MEPAKRTNHPTIEHHNIARLADKFMKNWEVEFKDLPFEQEEKNKIRRLFIDYHFTPSAFLERFQKLKFQERLNKIQNQSLHLLIHKYSIYAFQERVNPEIFLKFHYEHDYSKWEDSEQYKLELNPKNITWRGTLREHYTLSVKNKLESVYDLPSLLFDQRDVDFNAANFEQVKTKWNSCVEYFLNRGKLSHLPLKEMSIKLTMLFTRNKNAFNMKSVLGSKYFTGCCDLTTYCQKLVDQCKSHPNFFTKNHVEFRISSMNNEYYLFRITPPLNSSKSYKCSVVPYKFEGVSLKIACSEAEFNNVYKGKFLFSPIANSSEDPFIKQINLIVKKKIEPVTPNQRGEVDGKSKQKKVNSIERKLKNVFGNSLQNTNNNDLQQNKAANLSQKDIACLEAVEDPLQKFQKEHEKKLVWEISKSKSKELSYEVKLIIKTGRNTPPDRAIGTAPTKKEAKLLAIENYKQGNLYVPPNTNVVTEIHKDALLKSEEEKTQIGTAKDAEEKKENKDEIFPSDKKAENHKHNEIDNYQPVSNEPRITSFSSDLFSSYSSLKSYLSNRIMVMSISPYRNFLTTTFGALRIIPFTEIRNERTIVEVRTQSYNGQNIVQIIHRNAEKSLMDLGILQKEIKNLYEINCSLKSELSRKKGLLGLQHPTANKNLVIDVKKQNRNKSKVASLLNKQVINIFVQSPKFETLPGEEIPSDLTEIPYNPEMGCIRIYSLDPNPPVINHIGGRETKASLHEAIKKRDLYAKENDSLAKELRDLKTSTKPYGCISNQFNVNKSI